jgi:acyl-CoA synthetase (AMP-forming)/AMP-acid ligase II
MFLVEAVLRRHPSVWDATAVDMGDRTGRRMIAAVVQLAVPLLDPAAELAEYCRDRLPASEVPAEWVVTGDHAADVPRQSHRAPYLDS